MPKHLNKYPIVYRWVKSLCFFLWAIYPLVSTQFCYAGSPNRYGQWSVLRSEHFVVHYPADKQDLADTAAIYLEKSYMHLRQKFGFVELPQQGTTVVLSSSVDESNGFTTTRGNQIEIYLRPTPLFMGDQITWLKRVLAHELTHQMMFETLHNWAGIYGEEYKTLHIPYWFTEGIAQVAAESWDPNRRFFHKVTYAHGQDLPIEAIHKMFWSEPFWGRLVYEEGHHFVRYLVGKYGEKVVGQVLREMTVIPVYAEITRMAQPLFSDYNPLFMPPFEKALYMVTGRSLNALWKEYQKEIDQNEDEITDTLSYTRAEDSNTTATNVAIQAEPVMEIENFHLMYMAKKINSTQWIFTGQKQVDEWASGLWIRDGVNPPRSLINSGVAPVFDVSVDKRLVAYTKGYTTIDNVSESRTIVKEVSSGKTWNVGAGLFHPTFLYNDTLVGSMYRDGKAGLFVYHIPYHSLKIIEAPSEVSFVYGTSAGRTGSDVWVSAVLHNGQGAIYHYFLKEDFWSKYYSDSSMIEYPIEQPNGEIFFTRSRLGNMQIAKISEKSKKPQAVYQTDLGVMYLHRCETDSLCFASGNQYLSNAQTRQEFSGQSVPYTSNIFSSLYISPRQIKPMLQVYKWKGLYIEPIHPLRSWESAKYRLSDSMAASIQPPIESSHEKKMWDGIGIRPLIVVPFLKADPFGGGLGLQIHLQDPRNLHTIAAGWGFLANKKPSYDFLYINSQLAWNIAFEATDVSRYHIYGKANEYESDDGVSDTVGIVRESSYGILAGGQLLPSVAFPFQLNGMGGIAYAPHLNGEFYEGMFKSKEDGTFKEIDVIDGGHSNRYMMLMQWAYSIPSRYGILHPLHQSYLAGILDGSMGMLPLQQYIIEAKHTYLVHEGSSLTHTLWAGYLSQTSPTYQLRFPVSGDQYIGKENNHYMIYYTSLDLPVFRGGLEMPLLGWWEFSKISVHGSYTNGREKSDALSVVDGSYLNTMNDKVHDYEYGITLKNLLYLGRTVPYVFEVSYQHNEVDGNIIKIQFNFTGFGMSNDRLVLPRYKSKTTGFRLPFQLLSDR